MLYTLLAFVIALVHSASFATTPDVLKMADAQECSNDHSTTVDISACLATVRQQANNVLENIYQSYEAHYLSMFGETGQDESMKQRTTSFSQVKSSFAAYRDNFSSLDYWTSYPGTVRFTAPIRLEIEFTIEHITKLLISCGYYSKHHDSDTTVIIEYDLSKTNWCE